MALEKIMPDDMNEVMCALLAYISEGDKAAGAKMSYGDFGKHLAQTYGKHYHGSNPNDCWINSTPAKVMITTSGGTKYELTWNKVAKFIHPYLKSTVVSETVETDTPTDLQDTPTDTAAFDYSAVDEDTANYLRKATARIANSYADIGAVLAEAQERLAKHGFGDNNGFFEKWYSSLGMSKKTVYRFIQIHNFRNDMLRSCQFDTNENALEIFDNLPKMLQSDISSPSAPAEAVNAVLSGDITTHKDFIVMKKKLEESQAKVKELTGRNNRLTEDINSWSEKFKAEKSKRETLLSENDRLGAEIKELRSRPVETVTIEKDPTETEAYQTLLLENDELISKNDELNFKIQDLEGELEVARDNPDSIYNNPQAMQFEQLRDFFEDYYANANRAVRELYQFIKPDYPQDIKDYVRQRLDVLKRYINNLEELHEGEF